MLASAVAVAVNIPLVKHVNFASSTVRIASVVAKYVTPSSAYSAPADNVTSAKR